MRQVRPKDSTIESRQAVLSEKQAKPRSAAWPLMPCIFAVALIVLAVHWPVLHTRALCFDDSEYLTGNRLVQNPSWSSAGRFLTEVLEPSTVHGYYQPLSMISLMLDCAAGGSPDHLVTFHRTSLILHLLNTVQVIALLYLLFGQVRAAALVGLLYGAHPLTVEPIAWIGERKTLLAAFFALATLILYVDYVKSGRRGFYWSALAVYVLALMSKPEPTPLPICMLLLDYWPLNRLTRKTVLEKIPFLVIGAVSAVITFESQHRTAVVGLPAEHAVTSIAYVLTHNIIFYLRKIVWPTHLTAHYVFPARLDSSNPNVVIGVVGSLLLIPALIVSLRWTRAFLSGWLFFFIAIFPAMGVIQFANVIAADRFTYFPSLGLWLIAAYFLARLLDQESRLAAAGPKTARLASIRRVGAILVVLSLFVLAAGATRQYLNQWSDTERLFRYMLTQTPEAPSPHLYLGLELARQQKFDEAAAHYHEVIQRCPHYEATYFNLGQMLAEQGKLPEAIIQYQKALERKPDFAEAHNNLGNALLAQGNTTAAMGHYQEAIRTKPDYAEALYNLANVLAARGENGAARQHYLRALLVEPSHASLHNAYGNLLLKEGDTAGAIQEYRQALRYRPGWWQLAQNLAWMYATGEADNRNLVEAVGWAEQAVAITHRRDAGALGTLAVAYGEAGQLEAARRAADEAIALARAGGQNPLVDQIHNQMQKYFGGAPTLSRPATP